MCQDRQYTFRPLWTISHKFSDSTIIVNQLIIYRDRENNKTSVEIIQTIIFKADGRESVTSVLGYTKGSIAPGATDSWEDMAMMIPDTSFRTITLP